MHRLLPPRHGLLFPLASALALLAAGRLLPADEPAAPAAPSATSLPGEEAPPGEAPPRVARLVQQLGSDSYAERVAADRQLTRLGEPSRGHLEGALDSDDPEIRLRAEQLLKQLKTNALWAPSEVSCRLEEQPAGDAFAAIARQTGNRLTVGNGYEGINNRQVSVRLDQSTFWRAVDEVSRHSGNHVRPNYGPSQPGLVVVRGGPGQNPVAYGGPFRAQVTSARRTFVEQLQYDTLDSEVKHNFQLHLQMLWEDRFRLVAYRREPEVVMALTDSGEKLLMAKAASSGWNVAGSGVRQLSASLHLHPPPTSATELDHLTLTWGIVAVGDMASLDVLEPAAGSKSVQDDVELTVQDVSGQSGGRYSITVLVARDLIVPEPKEVQLHENRLALFDAQDRRFREQSQSSDLVDEGVRISATFRAEHADAKPFRLQLAYPRIRDQRYVTIDFRHVPLPTAQPE